MRTSWHDKLVFKEIMNVSKSNMERACILVERDVKQSMSGQRTGRKYKRGKKWHYASIKGETPAVDTGRLWNSITHRLSTDTGRAAIDNPVPENQADDGIGAPKSNPFVLIGAVGTNVNYGLDLETTKKRPFLSPALLRNESKIKEILSGK